MNKLGFFAALLVVALLVSPASAGVTFGDGGAALQGVLDDITVGGNSSINVLTDEVDAPALGLDEIWQIGGSGGSVATVVIELGAAFAPTNHFGLYDSHNAANYVEIFPGAATAGSQALVSILGDGSIFVNFQDTGVDFAANSFGYYLEVNATGNTYYSQTSLNNDGFDHMAAYQGVGDTIQIPPFAAGPWGSNEYILAWEDLPGGGNGNFVDFVVLVESVQPVPEPAAMLVWGFLGTVGLCWLRRRRQG